MCNSLHGNSTPIPEEGYGWKLFTNSGDENDPYTAFDPRGYIKNPSGYVVWLDTFTYYIDDKERLGFCFFTEKSEATKLESLLKKKYGYNRIIMKKIYYRVGLGKHYEWGIADEDVFLTGICKQFKIVEDGEGEEE